MSVADERSDHWICTHIHYVCVCLSITFCLLLPHPHIVVVAEINFTLSLSVKRQEDALFRLQEIFIPNESLLLLLDCMREYT